MVPGVAVGGELVAAAFQVAGGHIVEGEGACGEVLAGELALDGRLALGEPVERSVEVIGGGVLTAEERAEGGLAGGAEFALDAQLGAGFEEAGEDHGEGEGALGGGFVEEGGVEADAAGRAEEGADGAMEAREAGLHGGSGGEPVGESQAEEVDDGLGQGGEVGEGAFPDLAVLPVGFAEEMAGRLASEGGGNVYV